jgi:hypothetical protein
MGQNGGLSIVFSIRETEKSHRGPNQASRVIGNDSLAFGKNSLVKKEM